MTTRQYPSQKGKILEAAEKLILEKGIGSIKTDALIEASGLSKAGFFYHFKSMDDLFFELGCKTITQFYGEIQKVAEKDPHPIGRHIRAYVKVALTGTPSQRKKALATSRIFFEVLLSKPDIMDRIKKENSKTHRALEEIFLNDELPPLHAYLIQSAADGLWVNESLGITHVNKKMKESLCSLLIELTNSPIKNWSALKTSK